MMMIRIKKPSCRMRTEREYLSTVIRRYEYTSGVMILSTKKITAAHLFAKMATRMPTALMISAYPSTERYVAYASKICGFFVSAVLREAIVELRSNGMAQISCRVKTMLFSRIEGRIAAMKNSAEVATPISMILKSVRELLVTLFI